MSLDQLIEFARIEQATGDIEPWAATLGQLHADGVIDREQSLWLLKLYNAYDDLCSAFSAFRLWPSPQAWLQATNGGQAATFFIGRERRNLYGGRIVRHLNSYVAALDGGPQEKWLEGALTGDLDVLTRRLRTVWGVGRLAAFEWAEFITKITGARVEPTGAQLWDSSGPRRSLERLYGVVTDARSLDAVANSCRDLLAESGAPLPWWDFETVICDFHVMTQGRYYPGKHLAMIRSEVDEIPSAALRVKARAALQTVTPLDWARVPTAVDKKLNRRYLDTGRMTNPFEELL